MKTEEYTILRGQARIAAADFVQRYVDLADPAAGCRPCPGLWAVLDVPAL